MNPRQLIRETAALFRAAGIPDPEVDSAELLSYLTGKQPLMLRLDTDTVLSDDTLSAYHRLRDLRLQRIPLQYLTHAQFFLGRSFYVDERVLIPRPETELLAERAIDALRRRSHPRALDLCCGSGCLAASMALEVPGVEVHAADLSEGALAVSRRNAEALGAKVILHQGDLFAAVGDMKFDLIVSNPPYIPAEECLHLQQEVMQEPNMALDGGPDGYDFYRRIALEAEKHLLPGGVVLLEVGWDQAEAVCDLFRHQPYVEIAAHEDYQHILRMVEART